MEVKGSVELAPLTGMVEAIVDLTASGATLRENELVVREEITTVSARLIANAVAHKLKAGGDRRLRGARRRGRRGALTLEHPRAGRRCGRGCRGRPERRPCAAHRGTRWQAVAERVAEIIARVRDGGDAAVVELTRELDTAARRRRAARRSRRARRGDPLPAARAGRGAAGCDHERRARRRRRHRRRRGRDIAAGTASRDP